jgi:RNA 2',3'-cyclic 3'-phosphodiesterase
MSETTRTFIAVAVPVELGRELDGLQARLAPEVPGCRWTESPPFHITLAFVGDVKSADLDPLCEAVNRAAGRFEPFEVSLEGLGAFPSLARPRVIWAGVASPNMNSLIDLREAVVDGISEVGHRPDDLRFHPHVTLGRIKPGRLAKCNLTRLVERYQGWSAGPFPVEKVTTFASTLGQDGPIYTPVGRAQLKSQKS